MDVIATMVKPVLGVGTANPVNSGLHGLFERLPAVRAGRAHGRFEFATGLLDGLEVGGIRRQEQHVYASFRQPLAQTANLVYS